jgi:hypothetical protein
MPTRRTFLQGATAALGVAGLTPEALAATAPFDPKSWSSVREQFELDPRLTNFTTFLLAPHPRPVRAAIARHARALDRDAKRYLDRQENMNAAERVVRAVASI